MSATCKFEQASKEKNSIESSDIRCIFPYKGNENKSFSPGND